MKALAEIEFQLNRLGIRNKFIGKPEIKELANVLAHDEVITNASNGRYQGGFALLVVTDRRLLLIDKKMWYLSLEDVRFDMISELDYCARLLDSTLTVRTMNKVLNFTSWHQKQLRDLTSFLQDKIMELRHLSPQSNDQFAAAMPQTPPVQQNDPRQIHQVFDTQPQFYNPVPAPVSQPQQFSPHISPAPAPRSRIKRIGAYPTASLTMNRRFSR